MTRILAKAIEFQVKLQSNFFDRQGFLSNGMHLVFSDLCSSAFSLFLFFSLSYFVCAEN